jgi:transposase-like protein
MEDRLRQFRERVRRELVEGGKPSTRYSEDLRREAVACFEEGLEQGLSRREISAALGISKPTLRSWSRSTSGGLRPVEILAGAPAARSRAGEKPARVLVTPGGLRVEGLELEEIATLLRVLG